MHDVCCVLSCFSPVWLFVTLWTSAHQAPLSMGFSRQEYWCELPCPPPGDLPDPEIKPKSHVSCIGRWVLYHQGHLESPNAWYSFQMWKTGLGLARLAVKGLLLFRTWLSQSLWTLRLGRLLQTKIQENPTPAVPVRTRATEETSPSVLHPVVPERRECARIPVRPLCPDSCLHSAADSPVSLA